MSSLSNWLGQDDAKLAGNASKRATEQAERDYAETSPFRTIGRNRLTAPQTFDFGADYAGGPKYRAVNDPLYAQANAAQSKSLADLSGGVDRLGLVTQALKDFDAADAPRRAAGVRKIGQNAAALGRVGMEGVGTEIGDFNLAAEGERERAKNAMIRDAVEGTQADRYRTADLAGGIASDAYGRGANERGYGDSLSLADIERRVNQRDRERQAGSTAFAEGMDLTSLGYGFSPEGAYNREAATRQAAADQKGAQFNAAVGLGASFIPGVGPALSAANGFRKVGKGKPVPSGGTYA